MWKKSVLFLAVLAMVLGQKIKAEASDLTKEFDFSKIDEVLQEFMPEEKTDFEEVIKMLLKGEMEHPVELMKKVIKDQLFYEIRVNKKNIQMMLLICIVAAVFTNFSKVFQNEQITQIGFYMLYLLILSSGLSVFHIILNCAEDHLKFLADFMKALGPVYFLAVSISFGSATSVMFYNLVLFLIYLVEMLVLNFLLPFTHIFIVVKLLNRLSLEESLSRFADLLEFLILWTLKTLLAGIIGLNLIQSMILPAMDSLKRSVLTKGMEAVPVVGDALGGTAKVAAGTAILIKNGIGAAGALICIMICVIPVIKIFVITVLYKMAAALVQPVSDQRLVLCISEIADAGQIVLKIVFTMGILFLITIAVITTVTT